MPVDTPLLARIRGEYREMPGLRLTLQQACRLWGVDAPTGLAIFDHLVAERFLHKMRDGTYIAFPSSRSAPARASLPDARRIRARGSHRS